MQRFCYFHAGCPDGFGAAFSVWKAWGEDGSHVPRGHDDRCDPAQHDEAFVVFVDIAPPNEELRTLAERASKVVVLDHHVSSRERFLRDPALADELQRDGHHIHFDLSHSGAILAWNYFHPQQAAPDLLQYVEDQDLWNWKLPESAAVNAAIASYSRRFEVWDELAGRTVAELASEGSPIVRANEMEVLRSLQNAHPLALGSRRIEAVNATHARSAVGHELAKRAAFGVAWGCVYRVTGSRVDVSLYSIGDVDVSLVAAEFGGGGHRNAAGFSVPLGRWQDEFIV
ncbi:MAG: DHHA1 domain-containing protein [Proteobacteria bacterium]|nr:DHHA1 domain-containing protein [Pseudomonadota bacterium]